MTQSKLTALAASLAFAIILTTSSSGTFAVLAQEAPNSVLAEQEKLQKKLVLEIYEATKTANTAKDYSAIITLCKNALQQNLSEKNRDYVTSLTGWAKSRRGQERFELAQNLERVGNGQAEVVKKSAMDDFNESLTADPKRYRSWMARGIVHSQCGEHKKAAVDFTEVVKLKTDYSPGWFNRAESLYHLDQFALAIEDYNVVLRMDSDDAQALTGRAHSYLALKESDKAFLDYNRVIELLPESSVAFLNRGDAYSDSCEWQKSMADYEKSCSLKRSAEALQRMAWLKATCSDDNIYDPKTAVTLSIQAIDLGGKSVKFLETFAAAQAAVGDFDSAKKSQQNAIQLAGSEAEIDESLKTRLALYEENEAYKLKTRKKVTNEK